ncbi:MAG TPA: PIG-L family deacetylase [Methylomirabilota bacterium]|nr:PIG-L family deacetylase [Methylomirabilota bacterium]
MELNIAPPTEATPVSAERVLVLAPHADDEVFGCGGLLARLAGAGADIKVLYLTDSSGGDEVTEDRDDYARRRRAEAQRGLDVLGIGRSETLQIRDGALADHLEPAADAIARVIVEHRPDLLLSVSPCEVTSDHRAAFAALHRALSPLRGGTELDRIMAGCRILLYEVNHPGYPTLLVDVSDQLERLRAAVDAHASQLELHNYREAALGMRHFRALSLPADIAAAEGYRELGLVDLVSHGHAALVERLGGVAIPDPITDGPLVSVIVRTKDRPELLAEALASIAGSSYRRVEVVLVNDGGTEPEPPPVFPFPVTRVEMGRTQGRAAAANAGVTAAAGDYVTFLDDDDLMEPEHVATLVGLVTAAGVRVAYTDAAVGVYELDPSRGWLQTERRLPYSRNFDPELLLLDNYIPFNTLIIERELFDAAGPFDPALEFFEDWEFLIRLAAVAPFHHLGRVTAEYRHFRGAGHHVLGDRPRERADFLRQKAAVIARHRDRLTDETLSRVIDRLRAETVDALESVAGVRDEVATLRRSKAELFDGYHRLNGECEALRGERLRLMDENRHQGAELARVSSELESTMASFEAEVARLRERKADLRSETAELEATVARLYAEIERLTSLIEAMEGTRAWKLHRTIERLRGR